jgi:hypothetical protein
MHYSTRLFGTIAQPPATDGVWRWGATAPAPAPWDDGRLFAVREDATVVTEDPGGRSLSVWRGRDRARKIDVPQFGIYAVSGAIVHEWLCLTSPVAGLVVIDIDSGQTLRTIGQPGPDMRRRAPELDGAFHEVAPAPSRGLAVCDGYSIAVHDLSATDIRVRVDVPEEIEARKLVVGPDGRFAVATTVSRSKWTVGSTDYAVFDLDRGRLVATLDGHKPYTRKAAFVCDGRLLATASSDRTVRLWQVGTWRQVDLIDIRPGADEPVAVTAWDAHDAFVLTGERGLAYVFSVSATRRQTIQSTAPVASAAARAEPAPTHLSPDQDGTERTWSGRGWRFELAEVGEDQWGGVPAGVTAEAWPECQNCLHPMISVITLGSHPQRLPLRRHAGVAVFVCDSCVESYDPYGGANAALLLRLDATGRLARPPAGIEGEAAVLTKRALVYTAEPDDRDEEALFPNKVAGLAEWVQAPQTPVCRTCQLPMAFVAQLSDELDPDHLNFGYGIGYVFACPDEHDARFLTQP